MKTCTRCEQPFFPGDLVIDVRRVTGIVAPDDPDGYITTDPTDPARYVHAQNCERPYA